jgi:hypothetical protein
VFSVMSTAARPRQHRDGGAWVRRKQSRHAVPRNEAMSAGRGLQQGHVHRLSSLSCLAQSKMKWFKRAQARLLSSSGTLLAKSRVPTAGLFPKGDPGPNVVHVVFKGPPGGGLGWRTPC